MPRRRGPRDPTESLEREMSRVRKEAASVQRTLASQEARLRTLDRAVERRDRFDESVAEALQLPARPRKGDRGVVRDLQESIVRLEDYLLRTSDRIETILNALKQHRELLTAMNRKVLQAGTRDRIRLELDVMKNTLSILALHGIDFDAALVKDIEKLRHDVRDARDLEELEKAKAQLDRKFDDELKRFDLDAIWTKKREIPGYG